MDWLYTKRRGPEWKQGWTGQTLNSISSPPLHLLAIFAIVIVLLWLSQYGGYKAHLSHSAVNSQLFIVLFPVLFVLVMVSYSVGGLLNLNRGLRSSVLQESIQRGGSPWAIGVFLGLLLVLLSYQSSFHAKWFGPLWR